MPIKLIAMDMDGTLLTDDKRITAENAAAIQAARKQGITILLATGRTFEAALPYALQLNMALPLICLNGALIKNTLGGEILFEHTMNSKLAKELLNYCRRENIHVQAYWGKGIYTDKLNDDSRTYSRIIKLPVEPLGRNLFELEHHPYKLLLMLEPGQFARRWQELEEQFGDYIEITSSIKNFIEIGSPGINKWFAVKKMADRFFLARDEIMCIGDSHNDLSMILGASIGVAMGNASSDIQSQADWVTASNNDNGVAQAIYKVLQQ